MKMLPNMTVISPCDYNETKAATIAIAEYEGPVYLRFGRPKVPNFTDPNKKFVIGKADVLNEGKDVTIIATGHLVWKAIEAGKELLAKGINPEIINVHTIKPFDEETVLNSINKTKCVVTAEEHMMNGGLGDTVSQLLARKLPSPLEMVAVNDTFGESGKGEELLTKYKINTIDIIAAAERAVQRK
jgi:transketolase